MEGLKGAVAKETIVHEHDGFRKQFDEIEEYLKSCIPAGTKWGFTNDVVPASIGGTQTFSGQRLEQLIDNLVDTFLDHVSAVFPCRNPIPYHACGGPCTNKVRC